MKPWFYFLLILLCTSCASGKGVRGLACKKPSYKTKKYKVKKLKAYEKTSYPTATAHAAKPSQEPTVVEASFIDEEEISTEDSPSNASFVETQNVNNPPTLPDEVNTTVSLVEETPKQEVIKREEVPTIEEKVSTPQVQLSPKSTNPEIPKQTEPLIEEVEIPQTERVQVTEQQEIQTKKINLTAQESVAPKPEINTNIDQPEVIVFRQQEINISKGYSFNEMIPFVINKAILLHPDEADQQIDDLAILLQENPHVKVTIIANTATDEPHPSHRYGGDEETLSMMWEKDDKGKNVRFSLKSLMIARAKRIEQLLIYKGVNPEQISYQLGKHNMWKYQRYVTFILNDGE